MQDELNGLLIIDKYAGITSAKAVSLVKKLFGFRKVGHAGTLDPFATGILVCGINKATRLATFLLKGEKKYSAVLYLGVETDTQDATGTVISASDNVVFSEKEIKSVFNRFIGYVEQIPPVYSALKYKGVPLHKLARSGKAVLKPARRIYISHIEIKNIFLPLIHFEVSCSGGTYIRTLCSDIGKCLGCGGHLKALRRTESSGFTVSDALTLPQLEMLAAADDYPQNLKRRIISMGEGLKGIPELRVDSDLATTILNGNTKIIRDLKPAETMGKDNLLKVINRENRLLAVLKYDERLERYSYCCVFHP